MANEKEVFRFGKLMAIVRRIGHSKLYRVQIIGEGDEITTHLYASDAEIAAQEIIQELEFANENPEAFYIRRRKWIREIAKDNLEKKKEWAHIHELFDYAQRNVIPLWQATQVIDKVEGRRVI